EHHVGRLALPPDEVVASVAFGCPEGDQDVRRDRWAWVALLVVHQQVGANVHLRIVEVALRQGKTGVGNTVIPGIVLGHRFSIRLRIVHHGLVPRQAGRRWRHGGLSLYSAHAWFSLATHPRSR